MNGVVRLGMVGDRSCVDLVQGSDGVAEPFRHVGMRARGYPPRLLVNGRRLVVLVLPLGRLLDGVRAHRLTELVGFHPSIMLVDALDATSKGRNHNMATLQECREALTELTTDIAESGKDLDFNRSLSASVTDLNVVLKGRIEDGGFHDIEESVDPAADVKLTLTSDDLIQLCRGELNAMKAMATGKLKIQASMADLMKLRKLLK